MCFSASGSKRAPLDCMCRVCDAIDIQPLHSACANRYRRVLAAQPDRSVAISSIGIHTNLAALLKSPPDAVSALPGLELVRQKVYLLAVMGGMWVHRSHSCR